MKRVTLTPLPGRDYHKASEALAAYDSNADFILQDWGNRYDGKPINKQQIDSLEWIVNIRYDGNRKIALVVSS